MRLVLLHGAGLGPWIWDRVMPHLTRPALAVPRDEAAMTLEDRVSAIVSHLSERTILVGHSIAAMVAMVAAARRPQNVACVISVGGMVQESGKPFLSILPFPQR